MLGGKRENALLASRTCVGGSASREGGFTVTLVVQGNGMNELQLGSRLGRLLNESLPSDGAVTERLRAAREQALAHQRQEVAVPSPVMAYPQGVRSPQPSRPLLVSLRALAAVGVLAVAWFSVYSWQQAHQIAELEEVDAQLLADDLPIDAYLDQGFGAWLKKTAEE